MAKIVNEKYSMENIVRSSSQEVQMKVGKMYRHLKYFLFVGNLVSAFLKVPEFYKMVSLAIGLVSAKKDQAEDEQPKSLEMMLNIAFLYLGFLIVIINQIVVAAKIIQKKYNSLITYLVLFGIYLVFLSTAFFASLHESTMPLGCKFCFNHLSQVIHLIIRLIILSPSLTWIVTQTSLVLFHSCPIHDESFALQLSWYLHAKVGQSIKRLAVANSLAFSRGIYHRFEPSTNPTPLCLSPASGGTCSSRPPS